MSTMPGMGGGSGSPSDDDLLDVTIPLPDDELEITLLDDVVGEPDTFGSPVETARRGQNELGAAADNEPGDIDYDDPRFQDRLNLERRRADEVEARAIADQERTEAALVAAEKRSLVAQRDSFKLALDGIDVRIKTMTEALIYARQEDDVSAQTHLENNLNEARRLRSEVEANMARLPDERQIDADFQRHVYERRQKYHIARTGRQDDAPRALNEKAGKWSKANAWMQDPAKKAEKGALLEVNNALAAEGYDPNSDEFFVELSRRMAKRFPSLGVKSLNAAPMGQTQRPSQQSGAQRSTPPVAAGRSSAPPSAQAKATRGRVDIGSDDVAMMRRLRIDPNDKTAVKRYALEKHNRLMAEQARR